MNTKEQIFCLGEPEQRLSPNQHAELMRYAYNQIANPDDARGPIHALIPQSRLGTYCDAIEFMTATKPELRLTGQRTEDGQELIRVTALGYRLGPAGDH